jgi:hypothetical protein
MTSQYPDDLGRQLQHEGDTLKPEFSSALHDATMRRLRQQHLRASATPRRGWGNLAMAAAAMLAIAATGAIWFATTRNQEIILHPGIAVVQPALGELPTIDATLLMQKTSDPIRQLASDITLQPLAGMSEDAKSFARFLVERIPADSLRRPTLKTTPPT